MRFAIVPTLLVTRSLSLTPHMELHHSKLLVICGPSGSGKTTLLKLLMGEFPDQLGYAVSHTTRAKRQGEQDHVHYHFTSRERMQQDIENGKFVESACFGGNLYGTSRKAVEDVFSNNKTCVLDVDVQGVQSLKKMALEGWYVFVKPAALAVLEERLRLRNTESEESLRARLQAAEDEMKYAEGVGNFDFVVVNDVLERSYEKLREFVTSRVLKTSR